MLVTLGHTTNFVIQYDNKLKDGKRRAKALKSTCEADFAQLRSWFTATGGFGPQNRVTISIISTGLGANGQYQTGGEMWIQINGFDGKANKDLADDAVRAVFVAEAVELLMSYQNINTKKTTWHPGWSDGEGLSRVSMELLYFEAAYQLIGAPYVNTWMQSSKRPDFISKNQTTDENVTSYGCAMLFIYYLYSQLGFSLPAIINKAGGTLGETYSKDVTSGLVLATLDSQKLTYEKQYYKDLAGCRLGALHQFGPIQEIAPWVTLLLTLPDPGPEVTLGAAAVLSAVSSEIAAISATRPEIGQQVAMTMSRILNVPVAMLLIGTTPAGG